MNHDFIAAHDVIARYVSDRLTADDERDFEAHLVDCARCTGEVEQELALRDGLAAAAAERTAAPRPAAPVRRSSSSGVWLQAAAAVLVAVAVGLAFSLARTTSALNAALNQREEQQRRADEAARTAQGLERRIADLEARVSERSPERAGGRRTPTDALLPTAVFALTAVRGGGTGAIDTFTLDPAQLAPLVVLTVDVPPGEYAVTLKDGRGRDVWSGGRFRPSAQDVMAVAVERRVLADGRYTLEVHRRDAAGQATLAARYPFQLSSR
jgi:anti-sigma factor RsiW